MHLEWRIVYYSFYFSEDRLCLSSVHPDDIVAFLFGTLSECSLFARVCIYELPIYKGNRIEMFCGKG